MAKRTKSDDQESSTEESSTAEKAATKPEKGEAAEGSPKYRIGDKLLLTVREPIDKKDARADTPGNYVPQQLVAEVEGVSLEAELPTITVRWHLPAAYGYDTQKGAVSTLVHVANGVWLETRKRARNVAATIETVSEEDYQMLMQEAATP